MLFISQNNNLYKPYCQICSLLVTKKYGVRLCISNETYLLLLDCLKNFIDRKPELRGKHITHNHIVTQICNYYLSQKYEPISNETHLLILDCLKDFIDHHPELRGKHITHNHIITQICNYYLGKKYEPI